MVFHIRCFSIGDAPANTSIFYTAYSYFFGRQSETATPSSQNLEYPSTLRAFTLAELNAATSNFDQSTKIGEGGFGNVHKGIIKSLEHPYDDICVAVKRGKRQQQERRQWETEVKVLGEIKHPNLVELIGYCSEDYGYERNSLLVYEYMPNGSVDDHLSPTSLKPPLSWAVRLNIAKDIAAGLTYLHEGMGANRQIIYRDIKPSNFLLDSQMNAKISDFGFATDGPQAGWSYVSTMVVGTKGYVAPEYVHTGRLTSNCDVWSYGIFLRELITGRRPIYQNTPENKSECMRWVCCYTGTGRPNLEIDPRLEGMYSERSVLKMLSIAKKCVMKNPKLRPTMKDVLNMVNEAIVLENQQPHSGQT